MHVPHLAAVLAISAVALAGCAQNVHPVDTSHGPAPTELPALSFHPAVTVDAARIASEPSIKVAADGTLLVCAPTGSVKYVTRPQDLPVEADKGALQSAIWTSKDNGTTWTFAQTMGAPYHSPLPGAGDCDVAIDAAGTYFMADQLGLAAEVVSTSHDGGATWEAGSPLASGVPDVDRMWLWPDPTDAGTVYMNFDHNGVGIYVSKTTDDGHTWTVAATPAASTAPGPIVATNATVAFGYTQGGQVYFVHSEDKGLTWAEEPIAGSKASGGVDFPQTFADAAGTLYVAWIEAAKLDGKAASAVAYVASHDAGKTWGPKVQPFVLPGRGLFLWGAAGSAGRIGFSWYEASDPAGPYYIHAGIVVGADMAAARWVDARVTDTPVRADAPCESGVGCTGGRELGDFQQCAVSPDGRLVVAFVHVAKEEGNAGHVQYAGMASGPSLVETGQAIAPWVV